MRKVLLALALCVSFSGMAQLVNVTSIDKVNIPESAVNKVAAISPQGDYILVTTDYNCGLTKYDLSTGASQVITTAQGAGFDAKISADGNTVVYRERSTTKKHLQMKAVKSKNLATGAEQVVVLVDRSALKHREDEVPGELLVQVVDDALAGAGGDGFRLQTVEFLLLPDVGAVADDLRVISLLDPLDDHRGIQTAGVCHDNFHFLHLSLSEMPF